MGELVDGLRRWDVTINDKWDFHVSARDSGMACEAAGALWRAEDLTDEQRAEGIFAIEAVVRR